MRRTTRAAVVLALCAAVIPTALRGQRADGFVPLFDGTLNGWMVENSDAGNFSVRDGVLRVEGPAGWLRSQREYADVTVRMEFRFMTADADSGLFVRAPRAGAEFMRGWPGNSYQVQIRNPLTASRLPPVGGLFRHGMPPGDITFDPALVAKVARPTGEWQELEVDVIGDTLAARLNGTEIMRAGGLTSPRGHIGLQGETGVLEFRSIEVREHSRP